MKIYILTRDQYLFIGLKHLLPLYVESDCILLNPKDEMNVELFKASAASDIFFFIPDDSYLDLLSLIHLHHSKSTVVIANNDLAWNVSAVFDFSTVPQKFMLRELLQSLYSLKTKNQPILFPNMTACEKSAFAGEQRQFHPLDQQPAANKAENGVKPQAECLEKARYQKSTSHFQTPQGLYPVCLWFS